jgi:DNA-binding HxlR family transcriptional regulator
MDSVASICPRYHYAVELIGARWSGAILRAVMEGRHRYAEIKAVIPGVSDTMLSQRLRWLQAEGVLERRVQDSSPVRVEYHLTAKGAALAPVVEALKAWAHAWVPEAIKDTECPSSSSSSPAPVQAA